MGAKNSTGSRAAMPRFDDIFDTGAGNGVNVYEFDSRTAPSHATDMTWAKAVEIIGPVLASHIQNHVDDEHQQVRIMDAWTTILRGV